MFHGRSAQKVKMNMGDGLSTIGTGVGNQPIAAIRDSFLRSKLFCNKEEMSHKGLIIVDQHVDRINMFIGYDQNMGGRGRVDIAEGGHLLIMIYICAGDIP